MARKDKGRDGKRKPRAKTNNVDAIDTPWGRLEIIWVEVKRGDVPVRLPELHPDEMKRLPHGAIRGTAQKQNSGYGGPYLYYVDREMRCRACAEDFVFSAKEQQYWYEELGFFSDSKPRECLRCRREKRTDEKHRRELQRAVTRAQEHPDDANAQLALAKASCASLERALGGNPDRGIGAARRARRLDSKILDALFWEARLQDFAGRPERARETMEAFLEASKAATRKSIMGIRKRAQAFLSSRS